MLIVLVLAGCGGAPIDLTPKPNQDHAVEIIWGYLGAKSSLPEISWRPMTSCPNGEPGLGFDDGEGKCVAGLYNYSGGFAIIMWMNTSFHETALAHELIHAWQFKDKGIADSTHSIVADWHQVPGINYNLQDFGL